MQTRDIRLSDRVFSWGLRLLSLGLIGVLAALIYVLYRSGAPVLGQFGLKFFVTNDWDVVQDHFGALAFIYGTTMSSLISVLLAVPVAVGAALVLTELADARIAKIIGFLVEMLAAIPSVVYGLWGIFVLAPWLRENIQPFFANNLGFLPIFKGVPFGIGMMSAGVILAIMIIPTICSISREVFLSIASHQREAALALGATRWETIELAVLKGGVSGIIGATILGLGRAIGETMAVTMVIGNRADITWSLLSPAQTMASVIANEYADASSELHVSALMAVGLGLFLVSFFVNALARLIILHVERRQGKTR